MNQKNQSSLQVRNGPAKRRKTSFNNLKVITPSLFVSAGYALNYFMLQSVLFKLSYSIWADCDINCQATSQPYNV